jgi:hypothetical protein
LEEPVGERWLRKKQRGARWTSGHTIGSRNAPHNPAVQSPNGARQRAFTGWAALRPKKSAHYTRAGEATLRLARR